MRHLLLWFYAMHVSQYLQVHVLPFDTFLGTPCWLDRCHHSGHVIEVISPIVFNAWWRTQAIEALPVNKSTSGAFKQCADPPFFLNQSNPAMVSDEHRHSPYIDETCQRVDPQQSLAVDAPGFLAARTPNAFTARGPSVNASRNRPERLTGSLTSRQDLVKAWDRRALYFFGCGHFQQRGLTKRGISTHLPYYLLS